MKSPRELVIEMMAAKITQEEIASACGVKQPTVSRWKGGSELEARPWERLKAFAVRKGFSLYRPGEEPDGDRTYEPLPEDDPNWRPDPEFDPDASVYTREKYEPKVGGALPELDIGAGGGEGTVGEFIALPLGNGTISGHKVTAEWLFPEAYLHNETHVAPARTIVLPVVGDSMEPTYRPGDRVLVDLSQNELVSDTVYVISDGHSPPQIKRLTRILFTDPVEVDVISDNPAGGKQRVELARLKIVGRVCGVVARR